MVQTIHPTASIQGNNAKGKRTLTFLTNLLREDRNYSLVGAQMENLLKGRISP